jgi:hypothetical protein
LTEFINEKKKEFPSQVTQFTALWALRSKTHVNCLAFLLLSFSTGWNAESGPFISSTE